jgi:chromosome segregation ATPase
MLRQLRRGQTESNGNPKPDKAIDALTEQLQVKDSQLSDLLRQLDEANRHLFDARQSADDASKRSDMLIAQLTQQLDRTQLQLHDERARPSWWQKLFSAHSR